MKFVCQKSSILNEISNAVEFTTAKSNLTITSNVYLEVRSDMLIVKATDQKMGYNGSIAVQGENEGHVCVRCDKFLNILKAMPDGNLIIEDADGTMSINNEENTISFNLRSTVEDYPELISADGNFFKIPKAVIAKLIEQTSFAVCTDETKYFMCGNLLSKEDNSLIMVGTDGKRLSYIKETVESEIPDFDDITIPSKFISILRSFNNGEGDFEVCIDKKTMTVRSNNSEYYTALMNTPFPNYKRVIPQNTEKCVTIRIKDMEEAMRRVSLLVENKFKRIVMQVENRTVTVYTEESDTGMAKETIDCEYDGEPFKCAFNYTYLQAPLKVMDGEYFNIWLNDPSRAYVIKSEPEKEYLHVIMPMQVN